MSTFYERRVWFAPCPMAEDSPIRPAVSRRTSPLNDEKKIMQKIINGVETRVGYGAGYALAYVYNVAHARNTL